MSKTHENRKGVGSSSLLDRTVSNVSETLGAGGGASPSDPSHSQNTPKREGSGNAARTAPPVAGRTLPSLTATIAELVGRPPLVPVICRDVATCEHVHVTTCPADCPHVHADLIDEGPDELDGGAAGEAVKVPLGLDGAENPLGFQLEPAGSVATCDSTRENAASTGQPPQIATGKRGAECGGQAPQDRPLGDDPVGGPIQAVGLGLQDGPVVVDRHRASVGCGVWIVKVNGRPEVSCGDYTPAFVHGFGALTLNPLSHVALCRACEARAAVPAEIPRDTELRCCPRCRHLRIVGERCEFCITQDRAERLAVRALERYERQWTELSEALRVRLDGLGLDRSAIWKEFWKVMAEARLLAGEQRSDVLNEREAAGNALDEVSDRTAARS